MLAPSFESSARFVIKRQIGAGGMGVVYEAFDREERVDVALKTLQNTSPQAIYRFKREFRALRDVRHPNLVKLGELHHEGGLWFFTMELIAGPDFLAWVRDGKSHGYDSSISDSPTLAERLNQETRSMPGSERTPIERRDAAGSLRASSVPSSARAPIERRDAAGSVRSARTPIESLSSGDSPAPIWTGVLPAADFLAYDEARLRDGLRQLAEAIATLHRLGMVHRDIKPANIRVTPDGRVVLLDFGLISDVTDLRSTNSNMVGTVSYMAPEQASSGGVGPASDWYSLGVVLYEVLCSCLPHEGTAVRVLLAKQTLAPKPPLAYREDVPEDLSTLCMSLLEFDPEQRPSAESILEQLSGSLPQLPLSPSPSSSSRPPFLGREDELAELSAAFERAREGHAVSVLVHGESGLGKTELIRQFTLELVEECGAVSLVGACYQRESVPYKGFDGVIDTLARYLKRRDCVDPTTLVPRNAALLTRVFPSLARVEAIAQAPAPLREVCDPVELRTRAFAALRELFSKLAERVPLVLTIDDWQWADVDSHHLLMELMRPPDAPPVLLLLSSREAQVGLDGAKGELPVGDFRALALGPLDLRRSKQLALALLKRLAPSSQANVDAIAKEAGGHPLYIDILVRALLLQRPEELGPIRLSDALAARVSELHPEAQLLLELISAAGEPLPLEVLRDASELERDLFDQHLAVLRVEHFVRSGKRRGQAEHYHDKIRSVVLERLSPETLELRHRRLAIALESAPETAPALLLRHLEGAKLNEKAALCAIKAAERARETLAFDRAASFYRTTLRLGQGSVEERRQVRIALADTLANAGRLTESAEEFLAAALGAEPDVQLSCRRRAAEYFLTTGLIDRGLDVLETVRKSVGVAYPKSTWGALWSILWRRFKLGLTGYRWKAREESEIPPLELTRWEVYRATSISLALVDNIRAQNFHVRGLAQALRIGERRRVIRSILYEAGFIPSMGARAVRRAKMLLERVAGPALASGEAGVQALVPATRGIVRYFEGGFRDAATLLGDADQVLEEQTVGQWGELHVVRTIRLLALARMGAWNELDSSYRKYFADAIRRGDRYTEATLSRFCNILMLVQGKPEAALKSLDEIRWGDRERRDVSSLGSSEAGVGKRAKTDELENYHLQHYFDFVARVDVVLYQQGSADAVGALAHHFEAYRRSLLSRAIEVSRAEVLWMRGRLDLHLLLRATMSGKAASERNPIRQVALSARRILGLRVPYGDVLGLCLSSCVSHAQGQPERALELAQRALERARSLELRHFSAVAERRIGQLEGGEGGKRRIEEADAALRSEGVADPERFAYLLMPWAPTS